MSQGIRIAASFAVWMCAASAGEAQWHDHTVLRLNGSEKPLSEPARFQIVTEQWNRVVAVPYIAYVSEKDRVLMLVSCDYPHQAMVLWSDDRGATWSEPKFVHVNAEGKPDTGMGVGLAYLGGGKATLSAGNRWFSQDGGATWADPAPVPPTPDGQTWNVWDPPLVERDTPTGPVTRLVDTGYAMDNARYTSGGGPGYSTGHIRFSVDVGRTWDAAIKVPQWNGVSEVALVRAKNGDLVAACRTDIPAHFKGETLDHYEGLAVSISKDGGRSWSDLNRLYDWGRHHPCMVTMPNGDIVMTYVVRKGYTDTPEGFPQFGVEAIVSRDNGQTWDLDHRYVLHAWTGHMKGPNAWWPSCQATSTLLLPDNSLLTAFGTGYRCRPNEQGQPAPRDVGLVQWRLSDKPVNAEKRIQDAPFDSDVRNVFDAPIAIAGKESAGGS